MPDTFLQMGFLQCVPVCANVCQCVPWSSVSTTMAESHPSLPCSPPRMDLPSTSPYGPSCFYDSYLVLTKGCSNWNVGFVALSIDAAWPADESHSFKHGLVSTNQFFICADREVDFPAEKMGAHSTYGLPLCVKELLLMSLLKSPPLILTFCTLIFDSSILGKNNMSIYFLHAPLDHAHLNTPPILPANPTPNNSSPQACESLLHPFLAG